MSDRHITHMVPVDGTEHTPVECYCHPDIHESNGTRALLGLDEIGVQVSPEGALTFMHHAASQTSQWEQREEQDDLDALTAAESEQEMTE